MNWEGKYDSMNQIYKPGVNRDIIITLALQNAVRISTTTFV